MSLAQSLLELAELTAREAGQLLVEGQRTTVEVAETKTSPTDVVTATDIASEQLIRQRILDARPGDGFVGEEGDDVATTGNSNVVWIADPIDGTVNYLYGIEQFAVSIAAEVDGEVLAGVVHNPMTDETFTAAKGAGAWLGDRRLGCSGCTDISKALVGTGYSYRADVRAVQAQEMAALLPTVRDVRRIGSAALDLCFVAFGRYDAYVERGLKPWDLAAAGLVVTEAGGRVEGMRATPPGERIVTAASEALYESFHERLVAAGFADWGMPEWP